MPMSRRRLAAILTVGLLLSAMALPPAAGAATITVVASGLDNPRGVEIGPNGAVFVAEAGEGGDNCVVPPDAPPEILVCFGTTGAVTRIWRGEQERILTGLPSLSLPGPEPGVQDYIGPADIGIQGAGNLLVSLGEPDPAPLFPDEPAAQWLGWLIKANQSGNWKPLANIGAFEQNNPDGGEFMGQPIIDSNPFGVAGVAGGAAVADSGGNDLLWTDRTGDVSLLAVFPPTMVPAPFPGLPDPLPQEGVPTSVTVGPDGAFYVGQLTGFPFTPGTANVYRVVPGQAPTVYASGFTNVMAVAFGPDGTLYVLEMSHAGLLSGDLTGALWSVPAGGGAASPVISGDPSFFAPGGMDVASDGSIYVSLCTVCVDGGSVVRVTP